MTQDQSVAYVMASVARLYATVVGMQAENQQRLQRGESLAYGEEAFQGAIFAEGLREDQVHHVLVHGEVEV